MGEAMRAGNLDARAQNTQLRVGVAVLAVGLACVVALLQLGAPVGYRTLLILPFFMGVYGLYAGLIGTCGFTALRGMRLTDSGPVPVADRAEMAAHRERGLRVIGTSAVIATIATALLVFA